MIDSYVIIKDSKNLMCYIDYKKLRGFRVKPRNKVEYDGVIVNKLLIIKTSFIEKLLKKKVKRKLDVYLKYIVDILDDEDATDSGLNSVSNDLKRYKSIVDNKYRIY